MFRPARHRKPSLVLIAFATSSLAAAPDSVIVEVSSGGVSMGSYQGGYLLGRSLRNGTQDAGRPRILTGASAGAINTLGGLHHAFHPLQPGSTWSPWIEWLGIDWTDLAAPPAHPVDLSLLSPEAIRRALDRVVDSLLRPPAPQAARTEVQVGFAITRFLPENVYPDLDVRSAAEKIVLRVRWRDTCPDPARPAGCYQVWTTGFGAPVQSDRRPVNHLWFGPFGTDTSLIRGNLIALALASSAYPVAFPPARLRIFARDWGANACPSRSGSVPDSASCGPRRAGNAWTRHFLVPNESDIQMSDSDSSAVALGTPDGPLVFPAKIDSAHGRWTHGAPVKFSDGGLFENQPLELAMKIAEDSGSVGFGLPFASIRMLSPLHYRLRSTPTRQERDMTSEWMLVLTGQPDPTSQELLRALERGNVDPERIELNTTVLPMATDHVRHFAGFFELRFRRFDFLAGLLDAYPLEKDSIALDSAQATLGRFEGFAWAQRFLGLRTGGSTSRPLLRECRRVADRLQIEANERDSVDLTPLAQLHLSVDSAFQGLVRVALNLPRPDTSVLDALELVQVLQGVLEQLESSLRARNEHALDTEARRYEAFQRGLRRLVPCLSERPSLARGRCLDIHRHPASGIDHLYLQMVRLVDQDVLGPSSSLTYPAALHHTRTWMGLQFGDRPRWAPPYIRIEGANPGFRVLQGFSLLPRRWAPMPVLDRVRGEIGLHPTWKSAPSQLWMPLRLGLETPLLPGVRWLSLFPSWTFSVPLTDSTIPPRPGVDLIAFDLVHLRLDLVEGKRPDITAGLRTGFDPATLVEGLVTGTTRDRDRRRQRRR